MPVIESKGGLSSQGFGEFAKTGVATYIEDVFSTYLYTGDNTNSRVITNGIDLAGKGGMVITAPRDPGNYWSVADTARGASKWIYTQTTGAQQTGTDRYGSFNSTGYTMGSSAANGYMNYGGYTYVSWTFRKQPKFFDVVTYTGDGSNRTIAHSLGSVPGCIIIKRTDTTGAWAVYHRSLANTEYLVLDTTAAKATGATYWNSTTPTSTVFSLGTATDVNANNGTYVAYLFAHDAGGFGLTGTDNVISCGSFTTDASGNATVNLGYEPQWVLIKRSDSTSNWVLLDTMRQWSMSDASFLRPNLTNAEATNGAASGNPTSTGFTTNGNITSPNSTQIYIAIRRGPMKTPTSGTSVFAPVTYTGNASNPRTITGFGFPVDFFMQGYRDQVAGFAFYDRLRGAGYYLASSSTGAETNGTLGQPSLAFQDGDQVAYGNNSSGNLFVQEGFRRAPGFFDEVCYTGTGSNTTQTHNLGVVPELIIVKRRDTTGAWDTYSAALSNTEYLVVNTTAAKATGATRWNSTTPTSTVFSLGTSTTTNASGGTYVAYLFASCPGVSKVGSYTGTGTTKQIDCGFTGGARFVLIKRTDSTGDWYVWDSARGIVAGNDPYLLLNSTAAEVTNTDYVDTYSAGFEISSTAPAAINANGGTFIYLAIA